MISFINLPIALFSLVAVPLLVALYIFQSKFKRFPVSSLFLWESQRESARGGRHLHRIKTPLLFFLELCIILFLFLAIATPYWQSSRRLKPLTIILDNSVSMLSTTEGESPRMRAERALIEEMEKRKNYMLRIILAADTPHMLGSVIGREDTIHNLLQKWTCMSPSADIEGARALAYKMWKGTPPLLIISDHAPEHSIEGKNITWWSFGRKTPNIGFINAKRTPGDESDRVLLEVANYSDNPSDTVLFFQQEKELALKPHQIQRLVLEIPSNLDVFKARLPDDALGFDNEVCLTSSSLKDLKIRYDIADEETASSVDKALRAAGLAAKDDIPADLLFTDREDTYTHTQDMWVVKILKKGGAQPYIGPFVLDRTHPLTEGLTLDGIIWGGSPRHVTDGIPLIMAGNVTLLTDDLVLNLDLALSNLQHTPNWPILIWNILQWRKRELPEIGQAHLCASNLLSSAESDLSQCSSGRWGRWSPAEINMKYGMNISWIFILLTLSFVALHLIIITSNIRGK
ncbi:MAG: vWA domain-containing protein [bacterium]